MKFLNPFKALWRLITSDKVKAIFRRVDSLIEVALPIVKEIAALTPTLEDDVLVALFEKYHLELHAWLALPVDQRGAALLYAATAQLQKKFPDIPWNQLQSAAQMAVTLMKAQAQ